MRRVGLALLLVGLLASDAFAAAAPRPCPTIADPAGDTGVGVLPVSNSAADMTAVDVAVTKKEVTVTLRLVGQPTLGTAGSGVEYEVYFNEPEEDTFVLTASLGNGKARYQLRTHISNGTSNATAESGTYVRDVAGRIGKNSVVITASRSRDMLVHNQASVFGRTRMFAGDNAISVGGETTALSLSINVDDTEKRSFVFERRGCR